MGWDFNVIDQDMKTEDAILQVLIDIRDVLVDISGSMDGVYGESLEANNKHRD